MIINFCERQTHKKIGQVGYTRPKKLLEIILSKTNSSLPNKRKQQEENRDHGENIYQGVEKLISFRQFS